MLFAINCYARLNMAPIYWQQVTEALRWPYSTEIHRSLAKTYLSNGLMQSAKTELSFVDMLPHATSATNVLGESDTDEIALGRAQQAMMQKDYDRWQKIVSEKTDYRDGFLILASLAYQRLLPTQAYAYAEHAFILDPNSVLANKILKFTELKK